MATSARALMVEWTRLERVLAVVCAFSPIVMWVVDQPEPLRDSISAYFAMTENQWYYVPLAAAAMLFIVNGTTKGQQWYNWLLGAALVGVLMFNTRDFGPLHMAFAILFFAGNVIVMALWSDAPRSFRIPFAVLVVVIGILTWPAQVISVWVAEFLALLVIAAHYLLDSLDGKPWDWYHASPTVVYPWSPAPSSKAAA